MVAFEFPELQFSDFVLLAGLIALMHGLTIVDGKHISARSGTALADRQAAATWTFTGILASLAMGLICESLSGVDSALVLVPLFFIGRWALYYGRVSNLLDFSYVRAELDRGYARAVQASLPRDADSARTSAEIYFGAMTNVQTLLFMDRGFAMAGEVVPVPLKGVLRELLFTPSKVNSLLDRWASIGAVQVVHGDRYYLPIDADVSQLTVE